MALKDHQVSIDCLRKNISKLDTHSNLDILLGEAGWELDRLGECLGDGNDIGAVNELVGVLAENLQLSHGGLEFSHHELLVVDHGLPEASSPWVLGDGEVALKAHLTGEWGKNFTRSRGVVLVRECLALEEDLEEDLGVEGEGGRVKGCSWDSGIDNVGCSDGVRSKESYSFVGPETSIGKAGQDSSDGVSGLRDGKIWSWGLGGGATKFELKARSTWAVSGTDSGSEVDTTE